MLAEASAAAELDAQNISVESLTDKYAGSAGDVSIPPETIRLNVFCPPPKQDTFGAPARPACKAPALFPAPPVINKNGRKY